MGLFKWAATGLKNLAKGGSREQRIEGIVSKKMKELKELNFFKNDSALDYASFKTPFSKERFVWDKAKANKGRLAEEREAAINKIKQEYAEKANKITGGVSYSERAKTSLENLTEEGGYYNDDVISQRVERKINEESGNITDKAQRKTKEQLNQNFDDQYSDWNNDWNWYDVDLAKDEQAYNNYYESNFDNVYKQNYDNITNTTRNKYIEEEREEYNNMVSQVNKNASKVDAVERKELKQLSKEEKRKIKEAKKQYTMGSERKRLRQEYEQRIDNYENVIRNKVNGMIDEQNMGETDWIKENERSLHNRDFNSEDLRRKNGKLEAKGQDGNWEAVDMTQFPPGMEEYGTGVESIDANVMPSAWNKFNVEHGNDMYRTRQEEIANYLGYTDFENGVKLKTKKNNMNVAKNIAETEVGEKSGGLMDKAVGFATNHPFITAGAGLMALGTFVDNSRNRDDNGYAY